LSCAVPEITGAVALIMGSSAIACASCTVRVLTLPLPQRSPPDEVAPGMTISRWLPIEAMALLILVCAPCPIDSISTTAATSMIMPSMVSAVRRRLVCNARMASPMMVSKFMIWKEE